MESQEISPPVYPFITKKYLHYKGRYSDAHSHGDAHKTISVYIKAGVGKRPKTQLAPVPCWKVHVGVVKKNTGCGCTIPAICQDLLAEYRSC